MSGDNGERRMVGSIEVWCGGMFSGKTEHLIRALRREKRAKRRVFAFKPVVDDRYHAEDLASHEGMHFTAVPVAHARDILNLAGWEPALVGVDEAQFFGPDIVDTVLDLANRGHRVIVTGLDLDYRGMPFGSMSTLLCVADTVSKLHAVCTTCGEVATRSQRLVASHELTLVGGKSAYEARCRAHWSPEPVFGDFRADE